MSSNPESIFMGKKRSITLHVDRASRQFVARDEEGAFWIILPVDEPWVHRQPFTPNDETVLEPVPGHYKSMLGLPS